MKFINSYRFYEYRHSGESGNPLKRGIKNTVEKFEAVSHFPVREKNRGREETCLIKVINQKEILPEGWTMVNTVMLVIREFIGKDKNTPDSQFLYLQHTDNRRQIPVRRH